jgi:hypothetical protein
MDDWIKRENPSFATSSPAQQLVIKLAAHDQLMAYLLIIGALPSKYGSLQASLEKRHNRGFDEWPKTLKLAKDILSKHVLDIKWTQVARRDSRGELNGVTLNQGSHLAKTCLISHATAVESKVTTVRAALRSHPSHQTSGSNPSTRFLPRVTMSLTTNSQSPRPTLRKTGVVQAAIKTAEAAPELAIPITAKRLRKPMMKMDGQQCKSSRKMSRRRDWSSSSRASGLH